MLGEVFQSRGMGCFMAYLKSWYNPAIMIYVNLWSQAMLCIGVRGFITGRLSIHAPAARGYIDPFSFQSTIAPQASSLRHFYYNFGVVLT